uniref:Uncharacterized protein n=1 Tax=Campylaephora sungminbooi TaxID=1896769 RepID=A0A1B0THZ1_9FLOR|nr:hypothetical protein BI106_gp186 [Campylaephora sungminbooi]AKU47341.1 hypothetical protein [Campylaephora sungminbooi]ALN11788.1 hypothetical protein 263 [Campylaephora sungminbooi]
MECINLNDGFNAIHDICMSFILKLTHLREVWLFNSFDGCQHTILRKGVKFNQISKIIIIDLNINTISGLLGILSSFSLSGRKKPLHIYGPSGLAEYIDLCKKYSHTNFCYSIYLYILASGVTIDHWNYKMYVMIRYHYFELLIFTHIRPGKFELNKAEKFNIMSGPLYGKLKQGLHFILPDGFILDGTYFINNNYVGLKNSLFNNIYHTRRYVENNINSNMLIYRL